MKINQKIIFMVLLVIINIFLIVISFNKNNSYSVVQTYFNKSKTTYIALKEEKEIKPEKKEEKLNEPIEEPIEEPIKEEIKEEPVIVYDGMTLEQLADKLNRNLPNDLANKGMLFASYSLELGIDAYLAVAIVLHETGCPNQCSNLVKQCNNIGGQKGNGCNGYQYFSTIDDGIKGFLDNLYKNYYSYGLTTADAMNSKYAESTTWASQVNSFVEQIKAN